MFADRREAGRALAAVFAERSFNDPIVFGLPRGGVVVASEVAATLDAPLDIAVVRKLGAPAQQELAIGAIAEDGVVWLNEDLIRGMAITDDDVEQVRVTASQELERRAALYRRGREPLPVAGRTAIVVDDGFATGATVRAAARWLRSRDPASLILAAPVGSPEVSQALTAEADEVVCPQQPALLIAIGAWYTDFAQVSDEEVMGLL